MKNTSIHDFRAKNNTEHITTSVQQLSLDSAGFNGINYSDILTRLIQMAGRYCKSYASDLFVYWETLCEEISDRTIKTDSRLFGFRENGVDYSDFVFNCYNNNSNPEYISIWRLDITVEPDFLECGKYIGIALDLYEVEYQPAA